MSFKDILSKLDQLTEAETKDTPTGKVHKGDYGDKYGKEDVRDQYGAKIGRKDKGASAEKEAPVKRGRGRPQKGADETGKAKEYDWSAFGVKKGQDAKLPKWDKSKTTKHSLKEYFEKVEEDMAKPVPVLDQGNKQAGVGVVTSKNPAISKMLSQLSPTDMQVVMKGQAGQPQQSGQPTQQPTATSGGATNQPAMAEEGDKWIKGAIKHPGSFSAKAKRAGETTAQFAKEKEHAPGKLGKQARLAQTLSKMRHKKTNEGDIPPQDGLLGAGLGAGRDQGVAEGKDQGKPGKNFAKIAKGAAERYGSKEAGNRVAGAVKAKLAKQGKLEEAKPDFLDLDKDGDKKESMKKAAKDKKKVSESMDNRLKAAHHEGKSHGLKGHAYCGNNYDDMEEARMYHEGYKEGLDECYGQVPIRGNVMADEGMQGTVDDMASFGAHTPEMDEGNAFTKALATTPKGGKFSVGGTSFTDTSNYDAKVFESWDNQLNSLLEEYQEIQEGISVSVSKGQQGSPDSVSVTAQDGDADKLLALVKSAGLGLFGDEQAGIVAPQDSGQHGGVDVVGDHDGMMALIKKATGGEQPGTLEPASSEDYADEEGHEEGHEEGGDELDALKQLTQAIGGGSKEETDESTCNECGSPMESCGCDHEEGHEELDEVESEDQMMYNVAEDNPPDTGAQEFASMDQEVSQDNASANSHGGAQNSNLEETDEEDSDEEEDEEEEDLEESYANSNDDGFDADIEFMTKIISGGLNKPKSTGQTTIPVIAGQNDREGYSVNESLTDWKMLAGLK